MASRRYFKIHLPETGIQRADLAIPLNKMVGVIKKQFGKHQEFVFTYKGNPVAGCNNHAWSKALKRAGIGGFR